MTTAIGGLEPEGNPGVAMAWCILTPAARTPSALRVVLPVIRAVLDQAMATDFRRIQAYTIGGIDHEAVRFARHFDFHLEGILREFLAPGPTFLFARLKGD